MARETKVGLIVGLGLILFVSIMVSEYFVDTPTDDEISPEQMSDFNQSTTNGTANLVRTPDNTGRADPMSDPQYLAAITQEQIERRALLPQLPEEIPTPPFPQHGLDRGTPVNTGQHVTLGTGGQRDIDISLIHDPRQATGNQLPIERRGPGISNQDIINAVELPNLNENSNQPTQARHTVRAGENITAIARQYYNDGNMWQSLRDANPGRVGPNGEVREGVVLVIPRRSTEEADPTAGLTELTGAQGDPPPRRQVRIITVSENDTLSGLASEHLGSARKWEQIMAVNTDVLDDPRELRAGMRLRIPTQETSELIEQAEQALTNSGEQSTGEQNTGEQGGATVQRAGTTGRTYTVRENDSLYRIAQELLGNGSRYEEIYQANRDTLSSPTAIRPGMTLVVPDR